MRLRRSRPGAAGRLRRTDLSPGRHRHQLSAPRPLRAPFAHLVINEDLFNAIGPAIVSGKSVFIYGPPGNGKTSIARAIGDFMNNSGGEIYVPYAFLAENSIITVYDQAVHQTGRRSRQRPRWKTTKPPSAGCSTPARSIARWVRIRRPVIVTGGELNLDMLDLRFNAESNFYQAPLHVKANGGVFLIDDFGRQLCSPKELLNRWILPLEDRLDFLTVASGKKFEVPFEQLTIFSTNLDPKDLVDDAFLRRIRHKVGIEAPTREIYERIFNAVAKRLGMNPCPEAVDYLYERYYNTNRCPGPAIAEIYWRRSSRSADIRKEPVQLTRDLIAEAAASFICEF